MIALSPYSRRPLVPTAALLLALAGGAVLSGCDNADESQVAINNATIRLDSYSSGGTAALPTERYRKDTYDAVISGLKSAADSGSPSQQAAANLLIARGHAGKGEIAAQNAATLERSFLSQLTVARGALDQWVSQNSVADALKVYDPAKDLADLDKQIADRLAEAEKLQTQKAAQEQVVTGFRSKADAAAGQAKAKRTEEAVLRKSAEGLSQTAKLDVITRANELRRAADKFDQESANFTADAAKESPRLDELQREVDRLKTQSELLRAAKTDIQNRHTKSIEQSNVAREESKEAATKLKTILSELAASRSAASSPTQEAVRAYAQASTAAKSAAKEIKASAQFAGGAYQQSLGDVESVHAMAIAAYAGTLDLISKAKPAVPDLGNVADEAAKAHQEFETARNDAKKAYEAALGGFGASGSKVDEDRLSKIKAALSKLADLKPEPAPVEAAPDAGAAPTGDAPAADAPAADPAANAAIETEVRAALDAMKPDLTSGNPDKIIPHLHFTDPQVKAAIEGLLPLLAKGKDLNTACTEKFGKPFADLVKETQSQAIKSNPMLGMIAPLLSGGDAAGALPSAEQYAKFLSPDSKINVIKPTEVQLTVDGVAEGVSLVKADASWKINVDLGQGADGMGMLAAAPMLKGFSPVLDKVTAKIREGGYPNADAMLLDLNTQLMGAMSGGMGKPPAPAKDDVPKPDGEPKPDGDAGDNGGGGGGG